MNINVYADGDMEVQKLNNVKAFHDEWLDLSISESHLRSILVGSWCHVFWQLSRTARSSQKFSQQCLATGIWQARMFWDTIGSHQRFRRSCQMILNQAVWLYQTGTRFTAFRSLSAPGAYGMFGMEFGCNTDPFLDPICWIWFLLQKLYLT